MTFVYTHTLFIENLSFFYEIFHIKRRLVLAFEILSYTLCYIFKTKYISFLNTISKVKVILFSINMQLLFKLKINAIHSYLQIQVVNERNT